MMTRRAAPLLALAALLAFAALACLGGGTPITGPSCLDDPEGCGPGPDTTDGPDLGSAETSILFIGNSLTFTNDLPGIVQALADSAGLDVAHASIVRPGSSLEDHWSDGVAAQIAELGADIVVLQQGPSSLPESGVHLSHWSAVLAGPIRQAGGEPALLMVWPSSDRMFAFDAVRDHYRAAALDVGGAFIPAGQAWIEAWKLDSSLLLYGADGFHPSYLGSLVAAHTVVSVLLGVDPDSVPALDDGVPPEILALVRDAADAAVRAWGISPP